MSIILTSILIKYVFIYVILLVCGDLGYEFARLNDFNSFS